MDGRIKLWLLPALLVLAPSAGAQPAPSVIAPGRDAGGYAAFPDEEGEGSSIRGRRLRVTFQGVTVAPARPAR